MVIEDGILKDYSGDPIHVVIPDGVVRIGGIMTHEDQRSGKYRKEEFIFYKPFPQRSPIEELEIPPSVKVVGDKAFEHCPNLRTVFFDFPKGLNLEMRVLRQAFRDQEGSVQFRSR